MVEGPAELADIRAAGAAEEHDRQARQPRRKAPETLRESGENRKEGRRAGAQVLRFNRPAESAQSPANRKVPRRPKNSTLRTREYLTADEIERMMRAARKTGRHGHRDAALILIGYRHGLRVAELISLRWEQVDFGQGLLHVRRVKNGTPATHPLRGPELRALRRLQREYPPSAYVFVTERGGPLTDSTVRHVVKRAGHKARLPLPVHPHMLRHGCGFYLANAGADTRAIQAYLGHRNISNTVRYTELAPGRFNDFWKD